jgi:hypothetical protein
MADYDPGEILHPRHCRVSASPDRSQIALTFDTQDHKPITVVLPMAGALGLQRNLAQTIYILTKMNNAATEKATAEAPTPAAPPIPETPAAADAPVTTH